MKILKLEIEGFRSFKSQTWTPGDLNVLIGPNGGGKSNLLRALELLKHAAAGGMRRYVQREGGLQSLVWDGQSRQIRLLLETTPTRSAPGVRTERLEFEFTLNRVARDITYWLTEKLVSHLTRSDSQPGELARVLLDRNPDATRVIEDAQKGVRTIDMISEEETFLSQAAGPIPANREIAAFGSELANWAFYLSFDTSPASSIRGPVVARYDKRVEADGQNLVCVLHTLYSEHRSFKDDLNRAMQAAFGGDFEELVFPPAADQRIQMRIRWKSLKREQSTADLSDGTLRFLYLLAILANPEPAPLIAIDEPETGLHPSMLPIVAEYAVEASRHSQVILTTHSPEFLNGFRDTPPTTTVVEWHDGESQLKQLSGESLSYWLKQYSLGELYRSNQLETMEP